MSAPDEVFDLVWLILGIGLVVGCAAVLYGHLRMRVDDWAYQRHEDAIVRQAVRELEKELEQ